MRKVILTAVLACLLTVPVLAQPGVFGGGAASGPSLLAIPDVQKELKLTDDQKKAVTGAREKMMETLKEEGFEGFAKARETYTKSLTKVYDDLKSEQKKRLLGIEAQAAEKNKTPQIFSRKEVQTALTFTDKQKDSVKDSITEMEKDAKELRDDAKGDREKFVEAFKKIRKMNEDTYDKITKTFSDDQKKSFKELQGEKFEGNLNPFGKGKGPGKKKKTDDF